LCLLLHAFTPKVKEGFMFSFIENTFLDVSDLKKQNNENFENGVKEL
jgi:hypothetical protein